MQPAVPLAWWDGVPLSAPEGGGQAIDLHDIEPCEWAHVIQGFWSCRVIISGKLKNGAQDRQPPQVGYSPPPCLRVEEWFSWWLWLSQLG